MNKMQALEKYFSAFAYNATALTQPEIDGMGSDISHWALLAFG